MTRRKATDFPVSNREDQPCRPDSRSETGNASPQPMPGTGAPAAGSSPSSAAAWSTSRSNCRTLMCLNDDPALIPGWGPVIADIARQVAHDQKPTRPGHGRSPTNTADLLHHGHTRRRPTATEKAFVKARDRTCRAPGCRRRAMRLRRRPPRTNTATAARRTGGTCAACAATTTGCATNSATRHPPHERPGRLAAPNGRSYTPAPTTTSSSPSTTPIPTSPANHPNPTTRNLPNATWSCHAADTPRTDSTPRRDIGRFRQSTVEAVLDEGSSSVRGRGGHAGAGRLQPRCRRRVISAAGLNASYGVGPI